MSKSLTVAEREVIIANFMKAYPEGISTSEISRCTGLDRNDVITAFNKLRCAGEITSNGKKGRSHWVYKEIQKFPKCNSIWNFADIIAQQVFTQPNAA